MRSTLCSGIRRLLHAGLHGLGPLLAAGLASGCVTHLSRFSEPARLESVALGASTESDDLLVVDVVWGIFPKHRRHILVVVPRGAGDEPPRLLGMREDLTPREMAFLGNTTERWTRARRVEEDLALPKDVDANARRDYAIRNVRDPSGAVDLVIQRTAEGATREIGSVRLPPDRTPPEVAEGWLWLAAPPLAAIDLAWIPITAASFVLLLPFGSWAFVDDYLEGRGRL